MAASLSGHRVKPTVNTKFHIDYDWWEQSDQDLMVHMISQLGDEQQAYFTEHPAGEESDWVDPETAEVHRVDALRMALQEAAEDLAFFEPPTSLVNAVFRVFLTNNNVPLTPVELSERIDRPAKIILRTLAGQQVYNGLRPYLPPTPSGDS
ncbi:MAG: hypothetical protein JW910_15020 [Anaerolineae bacterium]|nr:hypothetical protein [Anaerolineae bacterium]